MTELRRSLGLLDATMVNVGVIVGSAVFLTASDVARAVAVAFASYWGNFLPLSPRGVPVRPQIG